MQRHRVDVYVCQFLGDTASSRLLFLGQWIEVLWIDYGRVEARSHRHRGGMVW